MSKIFTIDEISDRSHYWRRDHRRVLDWLNDRNLRSAEHALSAARHSLECDARAEYGRFDTLRDAMDHALMAWCLANFELDESILLNLSAFYVTAPQALAEKVELAAHFLRSLRERIRDDPGAIEAVRGAAMALVASACHPPANRKQLPKNLPRSYIASDVSGQFNVGELDTHRPLPAGSNRGGPASFFVRPAPVLRR